MVIVEIRLCKVLRHLQGIKGSTVTRKSIISPGQGLWAKVNAVLRWLARDRNYRWLLVFDNVDRDYQADTEDQQAYDIESFFPASDHGAILITTRLPRLGEHGSATKVTSVGQEQGRQIVRKNVRACLSTSGNRVLWPPSWGSKLRDTQTRIASWPDWEGFRWGSFKPVDTCRRQEQAVRVTLGCTRHHGPHFRQRCPECVIMQMAACRRHGWSHTIASGNWILQRRSFFSCGRILTIKISGSSCWPVAVGVWKTQTGCKILFDRSWDLRELWRGYSPTHWSNRIKTSKATPCNRSCMIGVSSRSVVAWSI